VGDLIGEVRQLRLQSGLPPLQETLADVAERARLGYRAVLQDPLAALERQVQAREQRIAVLELIDGAQRLQVVFEAAVLAHAFIQRVLAGMTERRMAEIVRQRDRLG